MTDMEGVYIIVGMVNHESSVDVKSFRRRFSVSRITSGRVQVYILNPLMQRMIALLQENRFFKN